jgi:hypothetical protein
MIYFINISTSRSRDGAVGTAHKFPACSIVLQPTTVPHVPSNTSMSVQATCAAEANLAEGQI